MAAKKRSNKRPKSSEEPKPDPPPRQAGDTPGEPAAAPDLAAPLESQPGPSGPPVAGIGASAGGLDAFKKFFTAMPVDSGIAFVLIPHLDPKHESLMVELLARYTRMPVTEAEDGARVEANHLYIIPPNKYMMIADGTLRLSGPVARGGPQTSIDLFLRSLAHDKQEKAICVILSGTGAHGTLGLQAVKAAGGLAMVQDPETAEYPAMPENAIATGLADFVLPVETMPEELIKYTQHYYVNGERADAETAEAPDYLNQVLALLRVRTKLDFRQYRKGMLTRRIARRLSLSHFDQLAEYLAYLREHPDELQQLARDLLISVTSFFRDPEAWQALETEVIAPLVRAREPGSSIRIWSAGCATGEEAYSVAMLVLEQLAAAQKNCPVQVFATDVDDAALKVARQAIYPDSISADVSPERLTRFFTRINDSAYQVSKQLRETVTFARQNLISDAPFSRLDLVVCRNLLIYLEPDVQRKVISLLHFALNDAGYLFLGPSETIGRQTDLFEPVSKKWRIFRRIGPSRPERMEFPVATADPLTLAHKPAKPARTVNYADLTQRLLIEKFAPAAVLVDRKYAILYICGPADRYLAVSSGVPTQDLLQMAREGLRTKLRSAIHKAVRENAPVTLRDVRMKRNGHYYAVNVEIAPTQDLQGANGLLLITFSDAGQEPHPPQRPVVAANEESVVRQLEDELKATKEDLQTTIEELESSNEEFKAANEEVTSMNEELQSANEELETSKEELQSLNEELNTVNSQLHDKVHDLESANNDITNLLNCTDIATLFLDMSFRIRRFTPAATHLFKLIVSDVGRPISDIVRQFQDDKFLDDVQQLVRDLTPREKEVLSEEGRWYVRRLVPYRTVDNRIEGVVITFVDITERKKAEDVVVRQLDAIVESSADAIFSQDLDGTIRTWNKGAERLYGYTATEAAGRPIQIVVPDDRAAEWAAIMARVKAGEHVEQLETEHARKDGRRITVAQTVSPIRDGSGKVAIASVIARDITERKQTEERFRLVVESAPGAIVMVNAEGAIVMVNAQTEKFFGYRREELLGQPVEVLVPERFRAKHPDYRASYFASPAARPMGAGRDLYGRRKDGSEFPVEIGLTPIQTAEGPLVLSTIVDITERKQAEEARAHLAAIIEASEDAIISQALDNTIVSWNAAAERMYGYSAAEAMGRPISILVPPDLRDEQTRLYEKVRRGERVEHITTVRVRKDGGRIVVSLTISPVKDGEGQVTGTSVIIRDITKEKQAEEELRKNQDGLKKLVAELQAKNEEVRAATQQLWLAAKLASVGELAASIAHELNNPLGIVTLRVESVLGEVPADDPKRRPLEIVEQETKRMANLVANLLQFSRRSREEISTVDVPQEVTRALDLVQHHIRKRQIAVVQELAADTPVIYADRQKLRQVFLNLLTNASDAMPQGGTLTLRSRPDTLEGGKAAVRVEVADTGMGIPAEHLDKVFDPFFTTKGEGEGTGLGLAICRRVVEEHHGTIRIDSEVGRGTTVIIVLPVRNGTNGDRVRGVGLAETKEKGDTKE